MRTSNIQITLAGPDSDIGRKKYIYWRHVCECLIELFLILKADKITNQNLIAFIHLSNEEEVVCWGHF